MYQFWISCCQPLIDLLGRSCSCQCKYPWLRAIKGDNIEKNLLDLYRIFQVKILLDEVWRFFVCLFICWFFPFLYDSKHSNLFKQYESLVWLNQEFNFNISSFIFNGKHPFCIRNYQNRKPNWPITNWDTKMWKANSCFCHFKTGL